MVNHTIYTHSLRTKSITFSSMYSVHSVYSRILKNLCSSIKNVWQNMVYTSSHVHLDRCRLYGNNTSKRERLNWSRKTNENPLQQFCEIPRRKKNKTGKGCTLQLQYLVCVWVEGVKVYAGVRVNLQAVNVVLETKTNHHNMIP